ncbi:MAG TPA: LamG-like jellyroll fold domain-containing protein, partial [Candidatus Methanoperedens sp.]
MKKESKHYKKIMNSIYLAIAILMGSILLLATVNNASASIAPVVYWKLDETSGNTASDSSGNNNDGKVLGATWTAGIFNNGLSLNGETNNYVIKNPISYFATSEITAELWINTSDKYDSGTLFSYASSFSDNDFRIMDYRNLKIDKGASSVTTGISANDGKWHHIAVTWRNSDDVVKLYKDGVNVYTGTLAAAKSITSGGSLVLGQDQDFIGGGFQK